jgi:hypothetical protein
MIATGIQIQMTVQTILCARAYMVASMIAVGKPMATAILANLANLGGARKTLHRRMVSTNKPCGYLNVSGIRVA